MSKEDHIINVSASVIASSCRYFSRSGFQFDFGLERTVMVKAEKNNPAWSKFGSENPPHAKFPAPTPSMVKLLLLP